MTISLCIGSAVNLASSLFNNSCDVNTIKYHQVGHNIRLFTFENVEFNPI